MALVGAFLFGVAGLLACYAINKRRTVPLKYLRKNVPLRFLHIPKNAGTAVENIALRNGVFWGWWDPDPRAGRAGSSCPCSAVHTPPGELTYNVYRDGPTFAIVRNPYNRIVSEYNYRCKCGGLELPSAAGLNRFIQTALHKSEEELKVEFDCHLLSQSAYVWDGDKRCNVTDIAKVETLNTDLAFIGCKYDIDFLKTPIPVMNRSARTVTSQCLDEESVRLVNKWYKEDFQNFNYLFR